MAWAFLGLALGLTSLARPGSAQTGTIGTRSQFVFHVYVDPLQGDDVVAAARNPKGSGQLNLALSTHPHGSIAGRIQQAPYSFRTLTAALMYVRTEFYTADPNHNINSYYLPWKMGPEEPWEIHHFAIHCLPGIYAPILQTDPTPPIEPKSGLLFNGETFPLGLHSNPNIAWNGIPPGVSIQGASALDVIFDGRGREGAYNHIFDFQIRTNVDFITHKNSFIDSVTIRNVRSSEYGPPTGAGIVIRGEGKIQCVISNCFITDCEVGIAIDAYPPNPLTWLHSPTIVNNTIAWNRIGIWSGPLQTWQAFPANHLGHARPRVLNNIIDPRDPDAQFTATGTSCFEGLDPSDMVVQNRTLGAGPPIQVGIDFNAYPMNDQSTVYYNNGIYPPGWSGVLQYGTGTRTVNPTYGPRVDLASFMDMPSVLYVNDSFRVSEAWPNNISSRSPHDFRLSPMATPDDGTTFAENPLVNKGIDTSMGVLQFANAILDNSGNATALTPDIVGASTPISTNTCIPGLPGPGAQNGGFAEDYAYIHSWDWDCEGYGNPRVEERADFPGPPDGHSSFIDLGADEMGTLIMAGYINGTRIFGRRVPGRSQGYPLASPGDNNLQVYFFDRYYLGNSYTRPNCNQINGRSFHYNYPASNPPLCWLWSEGSSWWHYQAANPIVPNPDPLNPGRFTEGMDLPTPNYSYRRVLTNQFKLSGFDYSPFMRNLECDFSPHLMPDIHPGWGTQNPGWPMTWGNFQDVFASNPWYHLQKTNLTQDPFAAEFTNRFLYYNGQGWIILEGTINPPGTWLMIEGDDPQLGYIRSGPGGQFGPYGYQGSAFYSVSQWGFGDLYPGPDTILEYYWDGRRFNCQRGAFQQLGSPLSNLQTFLAVNGEHIEPVNPLGSQVNSLLPSPSQSDLDRDLLRARRLMEANR